MSEEMAAIDQSTLCAIEDRKRAAEMLVTISRQVAGSFAVTVCHCLSKRLMTCAVGPPHGRCGQEGEGHGGRQMQLKKM